jgi:ribosome biogenesis GTPase
MDPDTILECRIIGKFRLDGLKLTNPVAVGDRVLVEPDAELGSGVIRQIQPRQNYVVRQSPRRKHDLHLLASNIDQAVVVVTIVHPNLKQGFIDRFLLMTEPYDIPVTVVFNKCDLYEAHDMEMFEYIKSIYVSIGYQVLLASATHSDGLDDLRMFLKDKTTLVSGQSGVGKSTLINAIQPQLDLRTGEISDYSGKGQHTTTFAQMYNLDFGGTIIDTPGIKTLAFNHLEPMDVAHNFREFFALSDDCRFGGKCLHRNEPGCAVKAAIAEGQVSELRYANYLTIIEEIEDINYWERNNQY